ncbi:MAG: phytochelatin synthase family protein [Burkholderiales bacterium]
MLASSLKRFALALLLGSVLGCQSAAPPAPPAARPAADASLVAFASDEGIARLARATGKTGFPLLANQFEAQLNGAFCGPTTAAIVLNTVNSRSADLPRDHDRLRPDDLRHLPAGTDPIVPRFTQDNVIAKGEKTRAQVLGEPVTVNGQSIRDFGYQLRQLDQMLRANGLATKAVVVDDAKPEGEVRAELIGQLARPGGYAIVNYRREAVGQRGGGHISPLGGYDAATDSFLVLDVNPAAAGWVWMPTATLVKGMRTFDTVENRGYVLVMPR